MTVQLIYPDYCGQCGVKEYFELTFEDVDLCSNDLAVDHPSETKSPLWWYVILVIRSAQSYSCGTNRYLNTCISSTAEY